MTNNICKCIIICNQLILNYTIKFKVQWKPFIEWCIIPMEETELIKLAQNGDKNALARLVTNHEQTIYNFAFKICRDKEKAENIMQETFYSMVKSINQFGGNSKLSTWKLSINAEEILCAPVEVAPIVIGISFWIEPMSGMPPTRVLVSKAPST